MVFPNPIDIDIECHHDCNRLQGFCGASLGKLSSVTIISQSGPLDDFLGAFETVSLTTSILPTTLSTLTFEPPCPCKPSYCSLLPFTQPREISIEGSCGLRCSSTINDDTTANLARAMPKLKTLRSGNHPCETPGGVTVNGLAAAFTVPTSLTL